MDSYKIAEQRGVEVGEAGEVSIERTQAASLALLARRVRAEAEARREQAARAVVVGVGAREMGGVAL